MDEFDFEDKLIDALAKSDLPVAEITATEGAAIAGFFVRLTDDSSFMVAILTPAQAAEAGAEVVLPDTGGGVVNPDA